GGLMSYGPILDDVSGRVAAYVDKILKGAKPADLPVEQPTKLEMVVNRQTATALGLDIPPGLILRADEAIEGCEREAQNETSPPKFSASGRGRRCAASCLALCVRASLSDAAGAHSRRFSARQKQVARMSHGASIAR